MELTGRQVELEIGAIVIEGLGPLDRHSLAAGVERELFRMVGGAGSLPDTLVATAGTRALRGPALDAPAGGGAGSVGAAVARSLYGALAP